jgi:hypothetical protein
VLYIRRVVEVGDMALGVGNVDHMLHVGIQFFPGKICRDVLWSGTDA